MTLFRFERPWFAQDTKGSSILASYDCVLLSKAFSTMNRLNRGEATAHRTASHAKVVDLLKCLRERYGLFFMEGNPPGWIAQQVIDWSACLISAVVQRPLVQAIRA